MPPLKATSPKKWPTPTSANESLSQSIKAALGRIDALIAKVEELLEVMDEGMSTY